MYYCKIANTEAEFEAISRLNYQTFAEEIPQHPHNDQQRLVDAFHEQNTYLICYHHQEVVGMMAFRAQRPFSLDNKIGAVENFLPEPYRRHLCELRLLAMAPEYRKTLAFFRLIQAMYRYVLDHDYSACVISGTTRQSKLYHKIGFRAFAPEVGSAEARFVPMVLIASQAHDLFERLPQPQQHLFYPGPVTQTQALSHTQISHRSTHFAHLHHKLTQQLLQLSQAQHVAMLNGSGTLANTTMLQQLWQRHGNKRGLICINGEFGQRLQQQAQALGLQFDTYEQDWGQPFEAHTISDWTPKYAWVALVHGETSTGCLNDLAVFIQCKRQYGYTLAVDCISSFGAVPVNLSDVDFASATSGKAIGGLSGLSWVFYQQAPQTPKLPYNPYTDLHHYHHNTPFTLPAYLLANVSSALQTYPERYQVLQQHMLSVLQHPLLQDYVVTTAHYPTAITLQLPKRHTLNAPLNGLLLHNQSPYLKNRHWSQISVIQPHFEQDFAALSAWLTHFNQTETASLVHELGA